MQCYGSVILERFELEGVPAGDLHRKPSHEAMMYLIKLHILYSDVLCSHQNEMSAADHLKRATHFLSAGITVAEYLLYFKQINENSALSPFKFLKLFDSKGRLASLRVSVSFKN